jgi:hypothetical protein
MSDTTLVPAPILEASQAFDIQETLLRKDVDEMDLEDVLVAWSVLDHMEKTAKQRKTALRARLLMEAETFGEKNSKGSAAMPLLGGVITSEARKSKKINPQKMSVVCERHGIALEDAGALVFVPDKDKIERLVEEAVIPAWEVLEATDIKRSQALKVVKPPAVRELISAEARRLVKTSRKACLSAENSSGGTPGISAAASK